MLKLAFKNLWARRRTNIWLFVELVVVAIVGWLLVNPIVVHTCDSHRPLGYDPDRLVVVTLSKYSSKSPDFDASRENFDDMMADVQAMKRILREDARVESVAFADNIALPENRYGTSSISVFNETDTINLLNANYYVGEDFFTTFGLTFLPGSMPVEDIKDTERGVVLTRTVAERMYPGENAIGKATNLGNVLGVVEDVRMLSHMPSVNVAFRPVKANQWSFYSCELLIRLKPGVDADRFASDEKWTTALNVGNFYPRTIESVHTAREKSLRSIGYQNSNVMRVTLLVFFLVNLVLGVSGIFWMQTRKRSSEAGIMRAFGGTSRYITGMMLLEGVIITVLAWITGCALYFQYALKNGFNDGRYFLSEAELPVDWITSFPSHFAVISLLVLAILLVAVCTGILIPSRRIAGINVVEALHED